MSAESHPTLSGTIPAFEMLMPTWEKLIQENPRMEPLISQGLEWAYMYYARMDCTRAYIISMCK